MSISKFPPTDEQSDVITAIKSTPKLAVIAVPGSGKSTLLRMISNEYGGASILLLAYNNSIIAELDKSFPNNTTLLTVHSMAYRWYNPKSRGKRLINIRPVMVKDLLKVKYIDYNLAQEALTLLSKWALSDSVSYKININKPDFDYLDDLIGRHSDYKELKKIVSCTNDLIKKMETEGKDGIDITHDFYLKQFHLAVHHGKYKITYDILMMDEAQDASPIALAIFNCIDSKRKIKVGDPDQQLYSFLGAVNALKSGADAKDYKVFPLTKSFRMPGSVANIANGLIRECKGYNPDIKGMKDETSDDDITKNRDTYSIAYISRTNSKLIDRMLSLLDHPTLSDSWSTIRNPDNIFSVAMDINNLLFLIDTEKVELKQIEIGKISNKYLWFIVRDYIFENIREKKNMSFRDYLTDEYDNDREIQSTLNLLHKFAGDEIALSLNELRVKAKERFKQKDEKETTVFLTTAHGSKGLEFDIVVVEDDFRNMASYIYRELLNHYSIKDLQYLHGEYSNLFKELIKTNSIVDWTNVDEINLLFVTLSRAKRKVINMNTNNFNQDGLVKDEDYFEDSLFLDMAKKNTVELEFNSIPKHLLKEHVLVEQMGKVGRASEFKDYKDKEYEDDK